MKRVVLLTLHYHGSMRRGGFHWLAEAYQRLGWDVVFVTIYISRLTQLRGQDYRLGYPVLAEGNRAVPVRERFTSYVWLTGWHPMNLRLGWLNRATMGLFSLYGRLPLRGLRRFVESADLLIYESHAGLLLFDRFRKLAPRARTVYRVSDSLDVLDVHPVIRRAERQAAPAFDRVSSSSETVHKRFEHLPNAHMDHHGIDAVAFDVDRPDPYAPHHRPAAVFVGAAHVDTDFLARAARLHRDVDFHVIGPIPDLPVENNVIAHGPMPFEQTVPWLKHADIGLACWRYRPGAESFTDTLKIIQYTWCRLPIVAPDFIRTDRPGVVTYQPGSDASVASALDEALAMDRTRIDVSSLQTWEQLAGTLAGPLA
ncbi:MAG: glucuronosyltransferase [Planctomycetota bacterium]